MNRIKIKRGIIALDTRQVLITKQEKRIEELENTKFYLQQVATEKDNIIRKLEDASQNIMNHAESVVAKFRILSIHKDFVEVSGHIEFNSTKGKHITNSGKIGRIEVGTFYALDLKRGDIA